MQTLDPAILRCRGCRTEGPDIFKGCRHCPMRKCAKSRNLPSCGLCQEWKTCARLSDVLMAAIICSMFAGLAGRSCTCSSTRPKPWLSSA